MQGEKITKKIIEDAKLKANSIIEDAQNQADLILTEAKKFADDKKEETLKKVENFKESTIEKYNTLLKIEENKILLNERQNILNDLKKEAKAFLLDMKKEDMLKFLDKIIKSYAEKEETLLFNIKDVNKKDLSALESVKKLKLNVVESSLDEEGIVLSNKNCDKNLLFSSLIDCSFEKNDWKINELLFK